MIHSLTTALIILAFLQALVFVLRYAMTTWFQTPMGRHAMVFMLVCVLVLGLGSSFQLWGEWLGRDVARVISYSLINMVFSWRIYLLFSGQRRARQARKDTDSVAR